MDSPLGSWLGEVGSLLWVGSSQPEQRPSGSDDPTQSSDPTSPSQDPSGESTEDPSAEGSDFAPESWYETNYWERSDREKAGLRGPVKKWYNNKSKSYREYNYNEAGNITLIRDVDPESTRGNWMEQRFYDENGRLVKKIYGRSTAPGSTEFDDWATKDVWTYEYNNPGKYVWVRPDDTFFSSKTAFRRLSPESYAEHMVEMPGDLIMKDLSAIRNTNESAMNENVRPHYDYEYTFDSDGNMVYSSHTYYCAYDRQTGQEGDILGTEDGYEEWKIEYPVEYKDNYPYAAEIGADGRVFYQISSITWRDNGMPLKMEGMDGVSEFDPDEKRYICMTRWDCQPGNPSDGLFVFTFWETYTYNEYGDLIEMQERFNEESDKPWTRPTTWTFQYDSHGNWIRYDEKYMIAIDGPDGEVKDGYLTRAIEYY